eukprot:4578981-Alexandrium_andersonii.AAC.1
MGNVKDTDTVNDKTGSITSTKIGRADCKGTTEHASAAMDEASADQYTDADKDGLKTTSGRN